MFNFFIFFSRVVYVRGVDNSNIQHFVEKVIFNLHESFPKPKRGVNYIVFCLNFYLIKLYFIFYSGKRTSIRNKPIWLC